MIFGWETLRASAGAGSLTVYVKVETTSSAERLLRRPCKWNLGRLHQTCGVKLDPLEDNGLLIEKLHPT